MIVDDLSSTVYDRSADNLGAWLDELVLNDDAEYKNRMKYIWDPFAEKEHLLIQKSQGRISESPVQ